MNTDLIGLIAGVLTSFAMMPQLIKVIRTRNADDISILILIVLLSGLSLWVWYGIMKEDWQIILSNSFAVLVNLSLLAYCIISRKGFNRCRSEMYGILLSNLAAAKIGIK
ncbi:MULTISPECIES: SemiSWEET transporter [Sphingobacterium]|jgi:MtN3 and saliva related transmembrane protein|uniref:SemiSWEET transporter n=1 Tax=Sphingobacterium TaxID=28453 RepID=UPI0009666F4B|nr:MULTISPECIES: SemiSWEET transporter [Sphingobacterium]OJZ15151.1 MAG: hypothetical protein BGP15_23805 [Sphingobacterium sp. 40-24]QQT44591.1 SemiSWEET transporter [Sphingobacterium multivorum]SUJ87843.1 MtN3/saliva family [Sphingobacterium multivorum]